MEISRLLKDITTSRYYENQLVHLEKTEANPALYAASPELDPAVKTVLSKFGIKGLYTHQAEALEKIREGRDVVLCTTTASGKSLTYQIPIFEALLKDPEATALYISPLNALVNDQLKAFLEIERELGTGAGIARYTGALSEAEKRKIRNGNTNILLTNPEMVHLSFLAWHPLWKRFFSKLKFVVVDESHYYRGVIGSNMANLLHRLSRVSAYYGARPAYICCSATIGNPKEHTETLTGRKVSVIEKNGSAQGAQTFVFWNPPLYLNKRGVAVRKSSSSESSALFSRLVQEGFQTIAFTRARQGVERMYKTCRESLREKGLSEAICPYRSGYFDKERESIEKKMASGALRGVISTNALELGIDIGSLDACILDGYPGTVMSARQQAGRAGRSGRESLVVLVAGSNALDQYYMRNPEDFFGKSSENAVSNPSNPYILAGHLLCAAKEIPLQASDEQYFGKNYSKVVRGLETEGLLKGNKFKTATESYPHKKVSLRGIDTSKYSILVFEGERASYPIEKDIEEALAFRECYPGAIYLHRGQPYYVNRIDHEKKEIHAIRAREGYYTKPLTESSVSIKEVFATKELSGAKDVCVGLGAVEVTERVVGFRKVQALSNETLSCHEIEMPATTLETVAFWLKLPDRIRDPVEAEKLDFAGGIHALEHALISMYPLHLLVDRNDVGGLSATSHPDLEGKSGIFVYDGHRGGVGYSEKGYEVITWMLEGTLKAISGCPCDKGCPGCIQSPKCGNNNEPLDKEAAIMLLHELLGKDPYSPQKRKERHLSEAAGINRVSKLSVPVPGRAEQRPGKAYSADEKRVLAAKGATGKKEKTFVATGARGNMLGVLSAESPKKAAAKAAKKCFSEKKPGGTKAKPFEICLRDLGEGADYSYQAWAEIRNGGDSIGDQGKKPVRVLVIKRTS